MASNVSNVDETVDSALATYSEEEGSSNTPKLLRSTSRALRELGASESLDSTDALVTAYNEAFDEEKSAALGEWLQCYVGWFNEHCSRSAIDGVLDEIACLARVKPRTDRDRELVMNVICFLSDQMHKSIVLQRKTVSPLAIALQEIDESVFEGDVSALLHIADMLLCKLDPSKAIFTEGTYLTHSMTLFALHQAFLLVQAISPGAMDSDQSYGAFRRMKTKLEEIALCQAYFPSFFKVKLVEQCLKRLGSKSPFSTANMARRMASALSGCSYLYSFTRKALVADLDIDYLKKGYEKFKEVACEWTGKKSWYDTFVQLNLRTVVSCETPVAVEDLMKCFTEILDAQDSLSDGTDKDLLRFGVVNQLRDVALNGKSSEIRTFAVTELMYIATRYIIYEGWDRVPAMLETILSMFQGIHAGGENSEVVVTTIEVMQFCENSNVQEAVAAWLNGCAMEEKLNDRQGVTKRTVDCRYLFHLVRTSIGVLGHEELNFKMEDLRSTYKSSAFAQVPGLLDDQDKKDVANLKFHIVYC